MESIIRYFPNLSPKQTEQLVRLGPLYMEWNEKINVISRKDIDNLYPHHILHSLALARVISMAPDADILDLGTGGGLPGIPLAIMFPDTNFTLIDGTRKKITVVQAIAEELGLANVTAVHGRAEELKTKYDFVVCRAVAALDKLYAWSMPLLKTKHRHGLPNGLLTLKGGNIKAEAKLLPKGAYTERFALSDFFDDPYFEEKYVVYVQGR